MKLRVKRNCYALGRYWEEGMVTDVDNIPNHHFEKVSDDTVVTATAKPSRIDPMRPIKSGELSSLSAMANAKRPAPGGFASSIEHEPVMTSMRDLKKR